MIDLILSAICIWCIFRITKEIDIMFDDERDLDKKEYCPSLEDDE